jgi:flotillin
MIEFFTSPVGIATGLVVIFIVFVIAMAKRYVKVGPNEALIISGGGKGVRLVKGGGTFVWPIIEQAQTLSLELITLVIKTPAVYTEIGVPIIIEGVAQVKVGGNETSIRTAAEQFLSKSPQDMLTVIHQTLEGHLRAIVGQMTVENIYRNREAFGQRVQEVAASDLANMGLQIVSLSIKEITDEHGYLDALGKPRIAQVQRDATIGEAVAQSEAAQKSAQARQAAKEAEFAAAAKIAESQRDFELKQAEYVANVEQKKAEFQVSVNVKRAEQDLAYDIQKAQTAQVLKEKETRTAELEAKRKEMELMATIIKPAQAKQQEIQTIADAERYKLETVARGQSDATKNIGIGDAEANRAKGLAIAEINKAQGLAGADVVLATGQSEATAMAKKAEAWRAYNEAAIAQMFIERLPEIVRAVSEPLAKVEKIVIVNSGGGDAGVGASKITKDIVDIVAQVPTILEATAGVNLKSLTEQIPKLLAKKEGESGRK